MLCKRVQVEKPGSDMAAVDIRAFREACGKNGILETLFRHMPEKLNPNGPLGICFSADMEGNRFPYGIGFATTMTDPPEGLEVYPSDQVERSDYTCEIWIAVKKR